MKKLLPEEEVEQENPINETEERWGSSGTPSPAFSASLSLGPGARQQHDTQGSVCVEEVGKCSHVNKSVVFFS